MRQRLSPYVVTVGILVLGLGIQQAQAGVTKTIITVGGAALILVTKVIAKNIGNKAREQARQEANKMGKKFDRAGSQIPSQPTAQESQIEPTHVPLIVISLDSPDWKKITDAEHCSIPETGARNACQPCEYDEKDKSCLALEEPALSISCSDMDNCEPLEAAIARQVEETKKRREREAQQRLQRSLVLFRCDESRKSSLKDDQKYPLGKLIGQSGTLINIRKLPTPQARVVGRAPIGMVVKLVSDPANTEHYTPTGPYENVCISLFDFNSHQYFYGFINRSSFQPGGLTRGERFGL